MINKYIVTIVCDETTQHFIIKSLLSKNELYDELCKIYDEFDDIIINKYLLNFNFAYILKFKNETMKKFFL